MTPDQMVSALTFRDRTEGDFDLASSIDGVLGNLRTKGFGELQRRIILQVILALADLDFTRPSYDRIVDRKSYAQMRPSVVRSEAALEKAVSFLTHSIGLRTSLLLPYASIVVMLAIFFGELDRLKYRITRSQTTLMKKWFWATSFNGWFAGANTTDLRKAGDMMEGVAQDFGKTESDFLDFFLGGRQIRPFPESFDRRSARVRASLLVQIIAGEPRDPVTGSMIDGSAVFADATARDIPYFFPNQRRPAVSNPANRVILPAKYPRNARGTFIALSDQKARREILDSHLISREAFYALREDNFEEFIEHRERTILRTEQQFLSQFDLFFDEVADRNTEEIDADE